MEMMAEATSQASPLSMPTTGETAKMYACITCVQRKVKCDKRQPCSSCTRSRLICKYRATPPSRSRKRKLEDLNQALFERLQSHEAALRGAGVQFDAFETIKEGSMEAEESGNEIVEPPQYQQVAVAHKENSGAKNPSLSHPGILVNEDGGKRFYQHALIGALGHEFRQGPTADTKQRDAESSAHLETQLMYQQSSGILSSGVLPGLVPTMTTPQYQHPPPDLVMAYWSTFMENVHPLSKIIHAPSVRELMVNNERSPTMNTTDALRFSIYACSVASLSAEECQRRFGGHKASLLNEYQSAAGWALWNSSFLRVPDIDLLRANLLYLTSMFHTTDFQSLWIVMGSAVRMAQSQGLHRDGLSLGLPPFEVEMRRRLWWYIVALDLRLTELAGSESCLPSSMDTILPANLNDDNLDPAMTAIPPDATGASEMTFCLLKYEIADFMRRYDPRSTDIPLPQSSGNYQEKIPGPVELENVLEEKYLRFCDPIVPIQFLATTLARSSICKLKQLSLRAPGTRPQPGKADNAPSGRNSRLKVATRNIEYDNLIHCNLSLSGFFWNVDFYFAWGAPIFILNILTRQPDWNNDMLSAWAQIETLYDYHTEYLDSNNSNIMPLVLGGLTLKAWMARSSLLKSKGIVCDRLPRMIPALHTRHAKSNSLQSSMGATGGTIEDPVVVDMAGFDTVAFSNLDSPDPAMFPGFDWFNWPLMCQQ